MSYRTYPALIALLAFGMAPLANASMLYDVTFTMPDNFGSTTGAIDLLFTPSQDADRADVTISAFSPGTGGMLGTLPDDCCFGEVYGQFPGDVTIFNRDASNDYFQPFLFGDIIHFLVKIDNPQPSISQHGSTFGFGLMAEDGSPLPGLAGYTSDGTTLAEISYDAAGAFTVNNYAGANLRIEAATPEPSMTVALLLAGGIGIAWKRRRAKATRPLTAG